MTRREGAGYLAVFVALVVLWIITGATPTDSGIAA